MLLLIDNYDSFTYNLVQYFQELNAEVVVWRREHTSLSEVAALAPSHLVLSPGPGTPGTATICQDLLRHFAGKIPTLGVCLGHQCLAEAYGGKVGRARRPMHGKRSKITHDRKGLFANLPEAFHVTRYHSLIVHEVPDCLEVTAQTEEGEIMGLRHKEHCLEGVQFHPESIVTEHGHELLRQFLKMH